MKILLSPAKSLDFETKATTPETTIAEFLTESDYLAHKLQKMSAKKIGKLMHLSADLAHLNHDRYQHWETPKTASEHNKPCIFAFTGEVYKGFDAATLNASELKKAQQQVRILSGLYGLLKPLDLMYPYRLEMGTKWNVTPKTKNLYAYWGTKIADKLNAELDTDETIINLASAEYFRVVDTAVLKARIITPIFKDAKGGEYKIVMMYAKHARGAMARYIVQHDLKDAEDLKSYDVDGYGFNAKLSTEDEWVFTR
jgi:cytoplasmic iron level regulating protein YaaA (DUF328/UPF0246 family)